VSTNPDELTGTEQAVLLVLMAEGRAVRNPELKELGPELRAESRRRLNDRGLVESVKIGRGFVHELTDDGWATARRIVGAEVPPQPSGQGRALYTLMRGLDQYLSREDLALADVFGASTAVVADAEGSVRDAYRRLAQRPGGWVALVRLRAELSELAHDELDAVLQRMYRVPGVHLIPEENQKVITDEDRAAAVEIGGYQKHLIAIEA
jgi:hypothetical protein